MCDTRKMAWRSRPLRGGVYTFTCTAVCSLYRWIVTMAMEWTSIWAYSSFTRQKTTVSIEIVMRPTWRRAAMRFKDNGVFSTSTAINAERETMTVHRLNWPTVQLRCMPRGSDQHGAGQQQQQQRRPATRWQSIIDVEAKNKRLPGIHSSVDAAVVTHFKAFDCVTSVRSDISSRPRGQWSVARSAPLVISRRHLDSLSSRRELTAAAGRISERR